jgi:flagellar biosynthesis protein FlhG
VDGQASLDQALLDGPGGVRLLAGGSGIPELAALPARSLRALARALAPLERAGGWLVVDMPAGLDRQSLLFLLAADQVLVVTTEDITALTDAYAVIKTLHAQQSAAAISLVVNQAHTHEGALEAYHRVAHVCRRFLGREIGLAGIVPWDPAVARSVASRRPVVLSEPHAASARAFVALARQLPERSLAGGAAGGFPSRLARLADAPPAGA